MCSKDCCFCLIKKSDILKKICNDVKEKLEIRKEYVTFHNINKITTNRWYTWNFCDVLYILFPELDEQCCDVACYVDVKIQKCKKNKDDIKIVKIGNISMYEYDIKIDYLSLPEEMLPPKSCGLWNIVSYKNRGVEPTFNLLKI
jgi:hypothetical protein